MRGGKRKRGKYERKRRNDKRKRELNLKKGKEMQKGKNKAKNGVRGVNLPPPPLWKEEKYHLQRGGGRYRIWFADQYI